MILYSLMYLPRTPAQSIQIKCHWNCLRKSMLIWQNCLKIISTSQPVNVKKKDIVKWSCFWTKRSPFWMQKKWKLKTRKFWVCILRTLFYLHICNRLWYHKRFIKQKFNSNLIFKFSKREKICLSRIAHQWMLILKKYIKKKYMEI